MEKGVPVMVPVDEPVKEPIAGEEVPPVVVEEGAAGAVEVPRRRWRLGRLLGLRRTDDAQTEGERAPLLGGGPSRRRRERRVIAQRECALCLSGELTSSSPRCLGLTITMQTSNPATAFASCLAVTSFTRTEDRSAWASTSGSFVRSVS